MKMIHIALAVTESIIILSRTFNSPGNFFRYLNVQSFIFHRIKTIFQAFAPLVEQFTQKARILSVQITPIIAAVWKVVAFHLPKWDSLVKNFVMLQSFKNKYMLLI